MYQLGVLTALLVADLCRNWAVAMKVLTKADDPDTKAILDATCEVLDACSKLGTTKFQDNKAMLECLLEAGKGKKLPGTLLDSIVNHVFGQFDDATKKKIWPALKNKDNAKTWASHALAVYIPIYKSRDVFAGELTGPGDVQRKVETLLNSKSVKSFKSLFKDERWQRPKSKEPLGNGEQINGVVYRVTDNVVKANKGLDLAMKLVLPSPKGVPNKEFEMHKKLSKHAFPVPPEAHFIPRYIDSGDVTIVDQKFQWIVMERIGITAKTWFGLPTEKASLRPTKEQIMLYLARTFLILREFHNAGFVHGDAHWNNWALSLTSLKVLFLFDYDTVTAMGSNYGHVIEDLWTWLEALKSIVEKLKDQNREPTFATEAKTKLAEMQKALKPTLWINPDEPYRKFGHYAEFAKPSYAELMATEPLTAFMKIVNAWVNPDAHALAKQEVITSWTEK